MKYQSAAGTSGVDRLGERTEPDAALLQVVDDLHQILERAGEPVEFPDHQRIALAQHSQAGNQFRAVTAGASGLLLEHLLAAARRQGILLKRRVLVLRANASVANDHQTYLICTLIYLQCTLRPGKEILVSGGAQRDVERKRSFMGWAG